MPEPPAALSIIVISFSRAAILERCLTALVRQAGPLGAEILVVRRSRETEPALRDRFPDVRWIAAGDDTAVPHMRSLGIASSAGGIVALLEDDCLIADRWCAAVLAAHQQPWAAVGGAIEPGDYAKALDWAVYFCEYARFMQPFDGHVAVLPGNNISYKRSALATVGGETGGEHGFHEIFANARLRDRGDALVAAPDVVVFNINSWSRDRVTRVPYHHARGYAGIRVAERPAAIRMAFAALALVLPAVQIARLSREIAGRRRLVGRFVLALPWIFVFAVSWSAGEWMGYLFGPGASIQRWR